MVSKRDFRKLDMATQAELRRVAVGMVQAGKTRAEAAATVGVGRRYVSGWIAAVERCGEAALAGDRRGRRPGEQRTLSPEQEKTIKRLISRTCPDQLGLPFALWTREAVGWLIERESGVRFASRSSIGGYLRDWGFTPQRPRKRATERHQPTVRHWLEHDYPAIAKRAKAEGAEIHWGDECGVSNQANYGRSFALRGQTPVIPRPATRFTYSMISTLTNLGTLRFMIFEGALTAVIFLSFLQRLVRDAPRKVFLIVDNRRAHRARLVTAWIQANSNRIEVFYLPPYAPEHNPDEFMHNDIKQAIARGRIPKDKASMRSGLHADMRGLQRRRAKVRSFFKPPSVRYAA